jgi:hypothetical protein
MASYPYTNHYYYDGIEANDIPFTTHEAAAEHAVDYCRSARHGIVRSVIITDATGTAMEIIETPKGN